MRLFSPTLVASVMVRTMVSLVVLITRKPSCENYNPANNTITALANQPNVSNHSTITVVSGP